MDSIVMKDLSGLTAIQEGFIVLFHGNHFMCSLMSFPSWE